MKKSICALLGLSSLILGCGNIKVTPMIDNPISQAMSDGGFCSMPQGSSNNAIKMLFMVDMSGSNIAIGNKPGTDLSMQRLEVIENFMSQPCANQNPNNKFGVIGFSYSTFGAICKREIFGTAAEVRTQLISLRNIQTAAAQDPVNEQTMTETYYAEGFRCAQSIVADDVNKTADALRKNTGYMIYFLTDGVPTDRLTGSGDSDIQGVQRMITPLLDDMIANGDRAAGLRISPILYGESLLPPNDVPRAHAILDFIADRGGSFTTSVDKAKDIDFCLLLKSGTKTKFTVKKFGVANLTALMRQGRLLADSDMDGIPDIDEVARGFDPTRARSGVNGNQLLDGVCPKGLTASQCHVFTGCSAPNSMGLSSCDISALGLTDGLDSDKDGMPDLLEIVKGTQANYDDRFNNIDGDSRVLMDEIAVGSDPFYPDDNLPPELLISFSQRLAAQPIMGCDANQESWTFHIDNVPLVPTLATVVDDPISSQVEFLKHGVNENVLFIYYIVGKANDNAASPTPARLYGQFVKALYGKSLNVSPGVFTFMGEINGIFSPIH